MGALVTLRDLDSIESINTQLQVSERLSALGRITAGVAHEVKNPLNSMRLWLENLKESLPAEKDTNAIRLLRSSTKKSIASMRWSSDSSTLRARWKFASKRHNFADILREVIEIAQPQLKKQKSKSRNSCRSTFPKST